jgi:putative Flp pilus-assembly TadE/G-like protein
MVSNIGIRRSRGERGQAALILILALSLVLVGGLGLVIDGSRLYNELQMAQSAADASATAAIMSIFQGVNTGTTHFATTGTITCTTSDTALPCQYARMNGFGANTYDHVVIDFPTCSGSPDPCGYQAALATSLPSGTPNQVRVTIQRDVANTIIQMLGMGPTTPIKTSATAAIVETKNPTPILITDPYNAGSLHLNGGTTLTVCGGPSQSIQVNSVSSGAYSPPSSGFIDLTHGGQADSGDCDTGTGSSFGNFGGPTNWGSGTVDNIELGTTGIYMRHSPIDDPFKDVPAPGETLTVGGVSVTGPAIPSTAPAPFTVSKTSSPNYGCTAPNSQGALCTVYSPGLYGTCVGCRAAQSGPGAPAGFNFDGVSNIIFKPGLYYVKGHAPNKPGVIFKNDNGGLAPLLNTGIPNSNTNPYTGSMCTDTTACPPDTNTGQGMVIYDTGDGNHDGGGFDIDTNAYISFMGPTLAQDSVTHATCTPSPTAPTCVPTGPYYGLTIWEDRGSTNFTTHTLGQGNGCFDVTGTVYITPTREYMLAHPGMSSYQVADYHGTPCSNTIHKGDIVVSDLTLEGTAAIKLTLFPYGYTYTYKVALVAGGPHP